jgi:hypothetical protein
MPSRRLPPTIVGGPPELFKLSRCGTSEDDGGGVKVTTGTAILDVDFEGRAAIAIGLVERPAEFCVYRRFDFPKVL